MLLRVVHSTESIPSVGSGKTIDAFCRDYHIGRRKGSRWMFTVVQQEEIRQILRGQAGINADLHPNGIQDDMSRSQTLSIAFDEKLNHRPVGTGRLRMKSLHGHMLGVMDQTWHLPNRMDMCGDLESVLQSKINHDGLLIIENLQTFDDIFSVDACVMDQLILKNPLIVYRGDTQEGARADAVNQLIQKTSLPVVAFFDFDPSGLIMASRLPRLNQMLAPPIPILKEAIQSRGLIERYQNQVSHASKAFFDIKNDVRLFLLWETIYSAGKALPQEYFHASCSPHPCGKQNLN